MDENQKQELLLKAREFFKSKIVANHVEKTKEACNIKNYNVNPFLIKYLANYAFGDASPESMAKALLYPRVLGTSIATIFGTQIQEICVDVFDSDPSITQGIDIEFIDALDKRKKYCQIKAGPNTINKDDVITIFGHFSEIKKIARTNRNKDINPTIDCIVGVLYGEKSELSGHYNKINKEYPVYCGEDFWYHITGDKPDLDK